MEASAAGAARSSAAAMEVQLSAPDAIERVPSTAALTNAPARAKYPMALIR